MKNRSPSYESHLAIREFVVPAGGEWTPGSSGWLLIQLGRGTGYYLHPEWNQELEPGSVILTAGCADGVLRASSLGSLSLYSFTVTPSRLMALLTLAEQNFFQAAALKKESSFQILPPHSPIALKMKELCIAQGQNGLLHRMKLLQLFVEAFGDELDRAQPTPNGAVCNARERLSAFLKETPASELLEMDFAELAVMTNCTSRHLSRIFRELVGTSFRNKRAELRLARARELLANTNSKVVDVALESGYKSLSLFNLMFARRFGTSPGKWRQKFGSRHNNARAGQISVSGKAV